MERQTNPFDNCRREQGREIVADQWCEAVRQDITHQLKIWISREVRLVSVVKTLPKVAM
jgi:hypothetical protein